MRIICGPFICFQLLVILLALTWRNASSYLFTGRMNKDGWLKSFPFASNRHLKLSTISHMRLKTYVGDDSKSHHSMGLGDLTIPASESPQTGCSAGTSRALRTKFAENIKSGDVRIAASSIGALYGDRVLFRDVNFSVATGERVALLGPNGCGKSTILKIISGRLKPDDGEIQSSSKDVSIAYFEQDVLEAINVNSSLRSALWDVFPQERDIMEEKRKIHAAMQDLMHDITNASDIVAAWVNRLEGLNRQLDLGREKLLQSRVDKVMASVGFDPKRDGDAAVGTFSGGWQMRIGIAKILLQEPKVLLLDEPTNHLDLESVVWLESFLKGLNNLAILFVSHDREFIQRVATKIVALEEGACVTFGGDYEGYLKDKANRRKVLLEQYEKQCKFVRLEEDFIRRAKQNPNPSISAQAKTKEHALAKLRASSDWILPPTKEKKFRFMFPPSPKCGNEVVDISKVCLSFANRKLFSNFSAVIRKGDRIGILGQNGAGKSTLLKLIYGIQSPDHGCVTLNRNAICQYFSQHQADRIDARKSVLQVMLEGAEDLNTLEVRSLLAQFMFKESDVDKEVGFLSGGERSRLALCKILMTPSNLLLLDEPTNHLDISSRETLENALVAYDGTVLIVSHDRYFVSRIVNKLFVIGNEAHVTYHEGDYKSFLSEQPDLAGKIESRYLDSDKLYRINDARKPPVEKAAKKNFCGSGVMSGNKFKGIKNAKRQK